MSRGAETIIYVYILFVNYRAYVFDITFLYYSQKHCVWLVFVLQFKHFISYIVEVVTRAILFSLISFNHADYDSSRFIVSFFHQNFDPASQVLCAQKRQPIGSILCLLTSYSISALLKWWSISTPTPPPRASPRCGSGGRCTPHTRLRRPREAPKAPCRSP